MVSRPDICRIGIPLTLPPWLDIAAKEIGIKEIMGITHHPKILIYHQATSLKAEDDETPWCSAFVNWCMQEAGYPKTDSGLARSWIKYGDSVEEPYRGCITVLERGKPWQGHVGFYISESAPGWIKLLGGNQKNRVSIETYPLHRVLTYREPSGYSAASRLAQSSPALPEIEPGDSI